MLRWIQASMNRHPIAAPIISAGVLSFFGDLIAQQWMESKGWSRHDWHRTFRQTFYGFFIIGPASCMWFRFLDAKVNHRSGFIRTFQRVLLDQLLFTPIFLSVYFLYNSYLEGATPRAIQHKFRNGYFPALMANYKVWPAVQCINFYLIPLNYRLLFVNGIAIGWCAYLSNLNSKHMALKHEL